MPLQPGSAPCMAMVVPAAAVKRNHEVDEEGGSSSEPVKSDVSPVVRVKSPNGPPWSHWTTLELKTVAPAIRQASVRSWTSGTPVELRVCGHVAWQVDMLKEQRPAAAWPERAVNDEAPKAPRPKRLRWSASCRLGQANPHEGSSEFQAGSRAINSASRWRQSRQWQYIQWAHRSSSN